jgi:indolepyruvate ferredoxin oxidoreductase
MRGLRGGALDVFGWPEVRRVERALVGEYVSLVDQALAGLDARSYDRAVKLAGLPDLIRGYEEIKLANVRRFRDEVRALGF